jgi:hypothetical protein
MKKSISIIALMLICFSIKVIAGSDDTCFIKSGDKTYFGKDLRIGLHHIKLILSDGAIKEFNNRDIIAYRHHDKFYMKLPVICDNKDTLCMEMMEYITSKSGCVIFMYCCPKDEDRLSMAKKSYFFVYKDGKFYCRIDEDQTEALSAYGIKVI